MSLGTANTMQNLQNDVFLGKTQIRQRSPSSLISVFAEEALGSWLAYSGRQGLWQDCTEVQADLSFCWAYSS